MMLSSKTAGETEEQEKQNKEKIGMAVHNARRVSQELSEFFETKYGYDGRSNRTKRDASKEKEKKFEDNLAALLEDE